MSIADDVLNDLHVRIGKTLDTFRSDLMKVRTGRASIGMLDGIVVDYYGAPTPLNGVATLTVADPRLIVIKPWDKSQIALIEKAIREANLGLNPQNEIGRAHV